MIYTVLWALVNLVVLPIVPMIRFYGRCNA